MNTEPDYSKLTNQELSILIEKLTSIKLENEQYFLKICKKRNIQKIKEYFIKHNYVIFQNIVKHSLFIDNISEKDIPFIDALKECKQWRDIVQTLFSLNAIKTIFNSSDLLEYFYTQHNADTLDYFKLIQGYFYTENETIFPQLYKYGLLNFTSPRDCIKDNVLNPGLFHYVITNEYLKLSINESESFYKEYSLFLNIKTLETLVKINPLIQTKKFITIMNEMEYVNNGQHLKRNYFDNIYLLLQRDNDFFICFLKYHPIQLGNLESLMSSVIKQTPLYDDKVEALIEYATVYEPTLLNQLLDSKWYQKLGDSSGSVEKILLKINLEKSLNNKETSTKLKI